MSAPATVPATASPASTGHRLAPPELVRAAQAGEAGAMEQLLLVSRPDIRRYAQMQCDRSAMADDVVQEALIVVYRRVGRLRQAGAYAAWVMRIVRRLCMAPVMAFSRAQPLDDAQADPANEAWFAKRPVHELRLDLARALDSLPDHHREVLLLRDFEELTISEIAERLLLTREAVKSRLHRARALVREYLNDYAGGSA